MTASFSYFDNACDERDMALTIMPAQSGTSILQIRIVHSAIRQNGVNKLGC